MSAPLAAPFHCGCVYDARARCARVVRASRLGKGHARIRDSCPFHAQRRSVRRRRAPRSRGPAQRPGQEGKGVRQRARRHFRIRMGRSSPHADRPRQRARDRRQRGHRAVER